MPSHAPISLFFFFNDTATTEIYTLSLHDALPIFVFEAAAGYTANVQLREAMKPNVIIAHKYEDRKSTRLNSSHSQISYAVFCLKKKTSDTVHEAIRCLPGTCDDWSR